MKGIEPIRTNVGAAGYGENFVRGRSIRDELFGRATRWQLLAHFVDGPSLTRPDAALLEDILLAATAPDPRIWPIKISWIVGAYGDWWAAGAAVHAMLAECRMGPWACGAACDSVSHLARLRQESVADFPDRAVAWARERWAAGDVLWGFGVAGGRGRAVDERLQLIERAATLHDRAEGPFFRAAIDGAAAIAEATGREPNMALGIAAVAMDMGMSREHVEAVVYQIVEPQVIGNAMDATKHAAVLRDLPAEVVDDQCRPPRRSPRDGEGRAR